MTTRKLDYRLSLPRFVCGHDRSPENTLAVGGCRCCHRVRQTRYRRRKGIRPRRARVTTHRITARPVRDVLVRLHLTATPYARERKPVVLAASVLDVIEASRAEYERAVKDSTDPRQRRMDFGGGA